MKILSIETSCDETAAAVIENGTTILSNVISSSKELHDKTGGVIPEIAAREQLACITPILQAALRNTALSDMDAIAVTIGPGLIGSLLIGVETAKTLSFFSRKPIIGVNHIHAHVYASFLDKKNPPEFPAIALVVSGGHTELFIISSHDKWRWIGGTLDDAAGEAFDKTARLLGLGYPGGPMIATEAEKFNSLKLKLQIKLPRPIIDSDDFNFSFSGLKTAVAREIACYQKKGTWNNEIKINFAHEIQEAITDVLVQKTMTAARHYHVNSIILGGGVAANRKLREKFLLKINDSKLTISLHAPAAKLCTDNAAVIGSYAYFHPNLTSWKDISAQPDLEIEV